MCEMRKRVVARSHDHNSIATTGQPNQSVAAAAAVWKSKGIATMPFNFANNFATSNTAVDSTAEIYGLGGKSRKVWISLAISCWTNTKRQNWY
jgi:hypothetical protein